MLPRLVGVNSNISSYDPEAPVPLNEPWVEISRFPLLSSWNPSMSSPLELRPTSLPSRYIENVPAVAVPRLLAVNSTTSESSIVRPPMVPAVLNDINISVSLITDSASISKLPRPTSEPSNSRLKSVPLKAMTSSSATLKPPTTVLFCTEK